jgi:hypothetical protein
MRRGYPTRRDRQRPAQDPPPRPRAGPALAAARPGPPGDLGLAAGPPRDQRSDQPGCRVRGHRPRPDLVHPSPAPRPPHRHRYGGLSPLTAGNKPYPTSSPRSPTRSTHRGATAPTPAPSSGPGTTATASRNPARPASTTPTHPRSDSTPSHHEPHDQLRLSGIASRPGTPEATSKCKVG